jgi:hypothetical protein
MSDPQKEQSPEKPALDSTAAAAVLARAVKSAEQCAGNPVAKAASVPLDAAGPDGTASALDWREYTLRATTLALALALGWAGGSGAFSTTAEPNEEGPEWEQTAAAIRDSQSDIVRLSGDVRGLKLAIEGLHEKVERAKTETLGQFTQVVEASSRLERTAKDSHTILSELTGRLEAIERRHAAVAAAKTATPDAADPAQTGSVEPKASAKEHRIADWILRDVDDGVALIENRRGRVREVAAGDTVPKAGRVESIERRGKSWVVVTSKGVIGSPARWR